MNAYTSDKLQRTVSGALAVLVVATAAAMLAVAPSGQDLDAPAARQVAHAQRACTTLPAVMVTARRLDPGAGIIVAADLPQLPEVVVTARRDAQRFAAAPAGPPGPVGYT